MTATDVKLNEKVETWTRLATRLGIDSVRSTTEAGSGHPTSCLSAAHLFAVLISDHLRFDYGKPKYAGNDRLVLSKGHAAPLLYAGHRALGLISEEELLSLRELGSVLQGHPVPTPGLPWMDVATGSLGQGLSNGLGMALAKLLDGVPGRIWVLLGDSEMSEGSVWEALAAASYHNVDNLTAIVDVNRLGQRGPTMLEWNTEAYAERARAFGWKTRVFDGHDVREINDAYEWAGSTPGPTMIIAQTIKGKGVSFLENVDGRHGKPLSEDETVQALRELGRETAEVRVDPPKPPDVIPPDVDPQQRPVTLPAFSESTATREAFGKAIAALSDGRDVICLDAELSNSTKSEEFQEAAPERFIELFICEQNMVGVATGLDAMGKRVVGSTFGSFIGRAFDFVRMAAIGRASFLLCGSHAGVSIGEDGPSQMALEDLAMMRSVLDSTVLYPSDANATVRLMEKAIDLPGITYLRTTRESTPKLYGPVEEFKVGGSKTLKAGKNDAVTVFAAGTTVFEALSAAERCASDGINVRVVDAYSVKPIDEDAIISAAKETGSIVVVEDHFPDGGLGSAIFEVLATADCPKPAVRHLAMRTRPGSAKPGEQRSEAGIDGEAISRAIYSLAGGKGMRSP